VRRTTVAKVPVHNMRAGRRVKAVAPDEEARAEVGADPVTHDDLVAKMVERLKAHPASSAVAGDRVYTAADLPDEPTYPFYFVSKGTDHGAPEVAGPVLAQADVRVESRAEAEEVIPTMTTAAQSALNGFVDEPVRQSVLIDTGTVEEEETYWKRRDAFGVFYVNTGE
jgi:hypothetical protein